MLIGSPSKNFKVFKNNIILEKTLKLKSFIIRTDAISLNNFNVRILMSPDYQKHMTTKIHQI